MLPMLAAACGGGPVVSESHDFLFFTPRLAPCVGVPTVGSMGLSAWYCCLLLAFLFSRPCAGTWASELLPAPPSTLLFTRSFSLTGILSYCGFSIFNWRAVVVRVVCVESPSGAISLCFAGPSPWCVSGVAVVGGGP